MQVTVRERRLLLAGAALSMMGLAASSNPLPVCLTSVGRTFGDLSVVQLGWLPTITFAGLVTGILLAGPLADRWGMRTFLSLGAALEVLGLVTLSLVPSYSAFLFATCLVGMGSGFVDALTSPLVADLAPDNRTSALNFLHACYPIGAVVMIAGSSALLTHTGSWRPVFPVMALPTVGGLLIFLFCRFPKHEGSGQGLRGAARLAGNLFFWIAMTGICLAGATEIGVAQWTPAYMEKVFSWTPSAGANVLLGFSLGMTVGRLGAGALTRHMAPARLVLLAAPACLLLIVIAAVGSSALAASALMLTGLFVACLWPTMLAYAADRVPGGGATMFSLLAAAGALGCTVSPAMVGLVADHANLRWGLGTVALFPLVATVLFTVLQVKARPRRK